MTTASAAAAAQYSWMSSMMQSEIIKFFADQKALTPEKAILVTPLQWASFGLSTTPDLYWGFERTFSYLRKTTDGKYWLDEDGLGQHMTKVGQAQQRMNKFLILFLIGVGIFFLLFVLTAIALG